MNCEWFFKVPGLFITGGVVLILIALIVFLLGSKKGDNKSVDAITKKFKDQYELEFEEVKTHVTISWGIAKYQDNINIDKWLSLADSKLYECKQTGKNKTLML